MSTLNKYYPRLSDVVTLDALPEQLGFIKDGLENLLDGIFVKEFQVEKSPSGDIRSYYVVIVAFKELGIGIPGTDFKLLFNPDPQDPTQTIIPISVTFEQGILKYVSNFSLDSFSAEPFAFFGLLLDVLDIQTPELLEKIIEQYTSSGTVSELVVLLNEVNGLTGTSNEIPVPTETNPALAILELSDTIFASAENAASSIAYLAFKILDQQEQIQDIFENIDRLFAFKSGTSAVERLKQLFVPKISAELNVSMAFQFPRNILIPIKPDGSIETNESILLRLDFAFDSFNFSTEGGIGYPGSPTVSFPVAYPKAQIGNTGLTIGFQNAKVDFSKETNIPEATADGRPNDFVGVFVEYIEIGLPPFIKDDAQNPNPPTVAIVGRNLLIGTGGLSGTVGLESTGPGLCKTFGDKLQACFNSFDITFQQNSVVGSNINGTLIIPGFEDTMGNDAEININVHFGEGGDFKVTASEQQSITAIKIKDILSIELSSVFVGREDGRWFFGISGAVNFDDLGGAIGNFIPDKIDIKKLIIWEDGKIELEGGKITLPKAVSLKLGPVELSITAVGLGSHEQEHNGILRQYKYFTFDGGISVNPGGVDASGNGITLYWTVDNGPGKPLHLFMRIQSISIDIIIPGSAKPADAALLLSGFLAMKDTPNGTEYQGGVDFTLPKLKMGGSAAMRLNPKVPAFIIDVGLELSTPILLGSTGLGIYGFRALVGQRYVATKSAANVDPAEPWWKYYKAKIDPDYKEGIQVSKFDQTNGFSLGAGVSLATASDGGKAFSSKIFFLLSLPEVFLLQGQGQILKERIGLDTTQDPPFFALISITSTSVETAFGVNYKIPDDGDDPGSIATVDGVIEMGFSWGNSFVWYINIGKDLPEDRRIQVRLLDLFNAYFYFMLGNNGIRTGAGASFEVKKKFGPLRAELKAYLDTAGRISRRPKEMGGSIQLGGSAGLYIFGFGFSIGASASLAAESAKPFIVSGSVEVCVKVLKKDRCAKFNFTWTFRNELDLSQTPLLKANLGDSAKALHMRTLETFDLWTGTSLPSSPVSQLDDFVIPLDSYIDIEFLKGVLPSAGVITKFGGNTMGSEYLEYVAPQRGKSDRVKHEYTLTGLDIMYYDGGSWQPFDIYAANTPLSLAPFVTTDLSTLKFGSWQYQAPNLHNKLRIMAQSPLNYVSQGSGGLVVEDLGITVESIFCGPDPIAKDCVNFDTLEIPGQEYGSTTIPVDQLIWHEKFLFRILGSDGSVINRPFNGYTNAIQLDAGSSLEIIFAEPQACVTMQMQTLTSGSVVSAYKREEIPAPPGSLTEPEFTYNLIGSKTILPTDDGKLNYENTDNPIDRIVIEAGICRPKSDLSCEVNATISTDLLALLNTMAQRKELLKNLSLSKEPYNVLWGGSSLYSVPQGCENPQPQWNVKNVTETSLLIIISDNCKQECELMFNTVNPEDHVDFKAITQFTNLRPDPATAQVGDNACFLVNAALSNGQVVTLKGCGCWKLISCKPVVANVGLVVQPITTEAQTFEKFLKVLAQNNDLTSTRVNLSADVESQYGSYLINSGLFTSVSNEKKIVIRPYERETARRKLNVLITETEVIIGTPVKEPGGGKKIISEPSNNLYTSNFELELTSPRKNFSFQKVVDFENLRVNPAKIQEGPNKDFLVDAIVRIDRNKVERVALMGSSPINIATAVVDSNLNPDGVLVKSDDPFYHENTFECGNLTPEALDIEKFLNRLTETKYLYQNTGFTSKLYPDDDALFHGYFLGTSLYRYALNKADEIKYLVEAATATTAHLSVSGGSLPEPCKFFLEIIDDKGTGAKMEWLLQLFNLRKDPDNLVDGANNTFLIDGIVNLGESRVVITLRGSNTCYPITYCKVNSNGYICDVNMTDEAKQLEASLNSFFQFKLLQNAGATMYPGQFVNNFKGVFFDTVLYEKQLVEGLTVTYTRTSLSNTLITWTIADNASYNCNFSLELITATQTPINELLQLHNLRPDPDNTSEGPNTYFLIDAYDQKGEIVTLRGNSCYTIINCAEECSTFVYGICTLNVEGVLFNGTIPTQTSVDAEVQTIINAFNGSLQPVWRPDTNYAIRIQTKDYLTREGGSYLTEYNNTAVYGFRTMGPIGHYHIFKNDAGTEVKIPNFAALESVDKEDEFKLRGLLYYLDFPKCYPNADGQLINAKPLFFVDPKLLLYYVDNQVYEMLNGWDAWGGLQALQTEFVVTIIDPALDETTPGASNSQGVLSWTLSSLPLISEEITILNNMMTYGDPCSITTIIDPQYPVSNFQLLTLKPLKLYTAVFHLKYKRNSEADFTTREVLRYPFQTSRYGEFTNQVQSWQLTDDEGNIGEAVFIVDREFDAVNDIQVAATVLDNTMPKDDPLRQEFGSPFNRLLEGALKLNSIDPSIGTEFNIIRNSLTNTVVGILIKNPEPFNDPKTPASEFTAQPLVSLTVNGAGTFTYLLAKDYAQIFISTNNLNMGLVDGDLLEFTFNYLQFDGVSYASSGTETVSFNINL